MSATLVSPKGNLKDNLPYDNLGNLGLFRSTIADDIFHHRLFV